MTKAEQAVIDHLAAEPGPITRESSSPGTGGWVASVRHGGGEGADPATVQFVKSRAFPGCQVHFVQFATHAGCHQYMLLRTWQQDSGSWVAEQSAAAVAQPPAGPGPGSTSPHSGAHTGSPPAGR